MVDHGINLGSFSFLNKYIRPNINTGPFINKQVRLKNKISKLWIMFDDTNL